MGHDVIFRSLFAQVFHSRFFGVGQSQLIGPQAEFAEEKWWVGTVGGSMGDLVDLITIDLDDALDPDSRAGFELHLLECGGCEDYL